MFLREPWTPKSQRPTRRLLASIARHEAAYERAGNADKAGAEIERYLAVFRDAMNEHGSTTVYSDLSVGYHWCCAFVYYCCLQAGFCFPPKPVPGSRTTLAAVPAWYEWASGEGFYHPATESLARVGDIALFNNVYNSNPLDHIGVVVEVAPTFVLCAEGNLGNRTGFFERPYSCIAGYVRLPESV